MPSVQVNCPHCGGALELKAPDVAERVACPYCNSLLDCTQGKLQYLETLNQKGVKPVIPLGTVGTLDGNQYTVIGFLLRHVTIEGTKYYWQEFLLYSPGIGFRWLVESDWHWSFVESVPPGEVQVSGQAALYHGRAFRLFQAATAVVDQVSGEFYWKVHIGEQVESSDYVDPPQILSREISHDAASASEAADEIMASSRDTGAATPPSAKGPFAGHGEINWSIGHYLPSAELATAFNVKGLPGPKGVAPNQPFPAKAVYPVWAVLVALAIVIWPILNWLRPTHLLLDKTYTLEPPTAPETTRHDLRIADRIGRASGDRNPRECSGEQLVAVCRWRFVQ